MLRTTLCQTYRAIFLGEKLETRLPKNILHLSREGFLGGAYFFFFRCRCVSCVLLRFSFHFRKSATVIYYIVFSFFASAFSFTVYYAVALALIIMEANVTRADHRRRIQEGENALERTWPMS